MSGPVCLGGRALLASCSCRATLQLCYVEFLAAAAQAELRSWQAVPALQACAGSGLSYD